MAVMIPKQISQDAASSERKIFERFQAITSDFTILHSVAWQSHRGGREADGEADFIVILPERGLLILEVKGGRVDVKDGEWYTTDRENNRYKIKDPFRQAVASKHALIRYLKTHEIETQDFTICHAVCFPDIQINQALGPAAPRDIIWDRSDISNITEALYRTFDHWNAKTISMPSTIKKITALLAPTLTINQSLSDKLASTEQQLIALTSEQIQQFQMLKRVRKAFIKGGAGTGKTLLAVERAKQLAAEGFKVAIFCYNELLGKHISNTLSFLPYSGTFHSFLMQEIKAAQLTIPSKLDQHWWEHTGPEQLKSALLKNRTKFDCIIIDEAQDFNPLWFDVITMLHPAPDDPFIYLFGDIHQNLYGQNWSTNIISLPEFELSINCRSTIEIAERASAVFGDKVKTSGIHGPQPRFIPTSNARTTALSVKDMVEFLIYEEKLKPDQIAVLSEDQNVSDRLTRLSAGEYPFVEEGSGIVLETIRRFKGLEKDVIILIFPPDGSFQPELIYTGLSRAKIMLFVFGTEHIRKKIKWN